MPHQPQEPPADAQTRAQAGLAALARARGDVRLTATALRLLIDLYVSGYPIAEAWRAYERAGLADVIGGVHRETLGAALRQLRDLGYIEDRPATRRSGAPRMRFTPAPVTRGAGSGRTYE